MRGPVRRPISSPFPAAEREGGRMRGPAIAFAAGLLLASCTGGQVLTSPPPTGPVFPDSGGGPTERDPTPEPPTTPPSDPESPTPTPSRPPGTIPVYGTLRARVVRVHAHGGVEGPSILAMNWVAAGVPGSEVHQLVQDPGTGDFRLRLVPFDLAVLQGVDVTGGSFGFEETSLPTNGPNGSDLTVDVPGSGCAYAGRITLTYLLLPDADSLTQLSLGADLAGDGSLTILFTSAGTFVYLPDDPAAHRVDMPPASGRPADARSCPEARQRFRTLSTGATRARTA